MTLFFNIKRSIVFFTGSIRKMGQSKVKPLMDIETMFKYNRVHEQILGLDVGMIL